MNHVGENGFSWMPLKRGRWPKQQSIFAITDSTVASVRLKEEEVSSWSVCLSVWAARRPITVIYDPSSDDSEECIRKLDMQSIGTSVGWKVVRVHKNGER